MRNKTTAILLCFFLGGIGGHKFYLGQTGMGIAYLLFSWTFIPAFIAFIEFIMLLLMGEDEFNRKFNFTAMMGGGNQIAQSVVVNIPGAAVSGATAPVVDPSAQLAKLHELHVAGALSAEEFAAEKSKVLGTQAAAPQLTP
jgi:TM2 domain-containing membrane protein YozV